VTFCELHEGKIKIKTDQNHLLELIPGAKRAVVGWDLNGSGGWTAPLGRSTMVQLQNTFSDLELSEDLQAWWTQEVAAIDACLALRDVLNCESEAFPDLFPYQVAGATFLATAEHAILGDPPGSGKTCQSISAARMLGDKTLPALVIAPKSTLLNWKREIERWWPGIPVLVAQGTKKQRGEAIVAAGKHGGWCIINWESARLHTRLARYGSTALTQEERTPKELNHVDWKLVIADECLIYDALITTPDGPKPLWTIQEGDLVCGVDHPTGEPVWAEVKGVSNSPLRPLVDEAPLGITDEHPVWLTPQGEVCYNKLYDDTSGRLKELRVVREAIANPEIPKLGEEVLRQKVLGGSSGGSSQVSDPHQLPGLRRDVPAQEFINPLLQSRVFFDGEILEPRIKGESPPAHAQNPKGPQGSREARGSFDGSDQPVPEPRGSSESPRIDVENGLLDVEWGERKGAYSAAKDAFRSFGRGLGVGTQCFDQAAADRLPLSLQNGRGESDVDAGSRNPWTEPSIEGPADSGPEEISVFNRTWLDSSELLERANPERSLWNLETSTGNYFADGYLVHNCHKLSDPKSKQTRAVWQVGHGDSVQYRWGLTATPLTDHIDTAYPLLRFITPKEHPSKVQFIDRYAILRNVPWGTGTEVVGMNPDRESEFQEIFQPRFRRMPKEIILPQLPPIIRTRRELVMSDEQARLYREMSENMVAETDTGEMIIAQNPGSKLFRLVQFSSASADLMPTDEGDFRARLKDPSNKLDALLEDLPDLIAAGESVVVFAASRQLIEMAEARLTKAKIKHGVIKGNQKPEFRQGQIDGFQSGNIPVMLVVISAGGVGINLNRARIGIFLQRSWSFVENHQAEGRIHRIGSEVFDSVQYIDYTSQGTADETVRQIAQGKEIRLENIVRDREMVRKLMTGQLE